jgi:hypothetical protein
MTSIASAGFQNLPSPLQRLQSELSSEVSAGTISSSDSSALSSALNDIDSALQSERSSASTSDGPPSPDQLKKKIDDLIAGEVKSGKLTDSQAAELKNIFAKTFQHGGPGGSGDGGDASTGGSSASSSTDPNNQLLQDFLKLLQDANGNVGYGASGDQQSQSTSLVVNYQT